LRKENQIWTIKDAVKLARGITDRETLEKKI